MFTILLTTICVLIILYVILFTLKDNPSIAPIFAAIDPLVKSVVDKVKAGLNWVANKIKSSTEPKQ